MKSTEFRLEMDLGMDEKKFDPLVTPYEVSEDEFPWGGSIEDQVTFLLQYAILAPSSHNAQAWRFEVQSEVVFLFADYERRLTVVDPDDRELIISLGAAIFNLRVAASHFGFETRVRYEQHARRNEPIAAIQCTLRTSENTSGGLSNLFPVIPERHTNRSPFLAARVARSVVTSIEQLPQTERTGIVVSTDSDINAQVAHLVAMAENEQLHDPQFRKELADWLRVHNTQRPDGIPGSAIGMGKVASASAPWMLKSFESPKIFSARNLNLCLDAPALVVLHSEDSISHWLDTGQLLQHVLLFAVHSGLQASFFNMAIEVPEYRIALRYMLGLSQWPQILLRLGYCLTEPARTPRRPIEEVVIRRSKES